MPMPIGAKNPSGFVDDARLDVNGNLKVALADLAGNVISGTGETSDGLAAARALLVYAAQSLFNGATFDRARTPNKFNTAVATAAGSTAIWTPAAGKKFRLMRYRIIARADAIMAVAAVNALTLLDAAVATNISYDPWIPSAAGTSNSLFDTGWVDLGNGLLSAVANNVLNLSLGTALTGGNIRVLTAGTEE